MAGARPRRARGSRACLPYVDRARRARLAPSPRRGPRMSLNQRTWLAFLHDMAACAVAWMAAFWLRFNLEIPDPYFEISVKTLAAMVPIYAAIFWGMGLYRGIWRYASLPDVRRIVIAIG